MVIAIGIPIGWGSRWEPPVDRAEHPAPQWTSIQAMPDDVDIPGPVVKLAEYVRDLGWDTRIQYARGNGIHGITGKPTILKHSFALKVGNHDRSERYAVAVYEVPVKGGTASWGSIWIWGPDLPWFGQCGILDLKQFLSDVAFDSVPALNLWMDMVRARVERQAREVKERAAQRRKDGIRTPRGDGG